MAAQHPGIKHRPARHWLVALLSLALLLPMPGCGGCRKSPAQAQKEKEQKEAEEKAKREQQKPKPPLQARRPETRPCGRQIVAGRNDGQLYKPGHWTAIALPDAKANLDDFRGQMQVSVRDRRLRPLPLEEIPYELTTTRDVALPKGQPKTFESAFFTSPHADAGDALCRLVTRGGSDLGLGDQSVALRRMPSYQYHFVVLARWPDRYKYLDKLDAIGLDDTFSARVKPFYHVSWLTVAKAGERLALPAHAMYWTSTACLLWDDAEPAWLEPEQQQALVDWLHWGGTLIVSGPETLDTLKDSFLWPYLPAASTGARDLSTADLEPLNYWTLPKSRRLIAARPWTGVKLALARAPEVRFVPHTGELVAEGRVGRGRVVVTAFRLSGRDLTDWPGCDNFFNAVVLERPPRTFRYDEGGFSWTMAWADEQRPLLDAALVTNLRYFSRDTGVNYHEYAIDTRREDDIRNSSLPLNLGEDSPSAPGLAAWNDYNPVAGAARGALASASRIEIPDRGFVLWVMAAYLVVLVPVNWLIFWLIGRVEWAWIAAPLIAVACTAVVIRAAQLDIGFVRARTEVAVVELQGDYARAHVTRYAALYTSLTSAYRFHLDDPAGAVQPFSEAAERNPNAGSRGLLATNGQLLLFRGEGLDMSGMSIDSASCRYIHGEEMLDLAGPLRLQENDEGGWLLANDTGLPIDGAGLVRCNADGKLQTAWLGRIAPGEQRKVVWNWHAPPANKTTADDSEKLANLHSLWEVERLKSPITGLRTAAANELNIRELVNLAESAPKLAPGQARLVGWTTRELPGLRIAPSAPQSHFAAMVVANLRQGFLRDPRSDTNVRPQKNQPDPLETSR